jgi:hypothetical protein
MVAGGENAFAGNEGAFCDRDGGDLVVNGLIYTLSPAYIMQAGGSIAFAGNEDAKAGRFNELIPSYYIFNIPSDPYTWPFIFFIGASIIRDPETYEITDIETAEIPIERKSEFLSIILKYKPLHTWCAAIVLYI